MRQNPHTLSTLVNLPAEGHFWDLPPHQCVSYIVQTAVLFAYTDLMD